MLASIRSVVGNADEFFSGMVSPFFSSCGDGLGGAASSTCWVPSRLVWPIFAVAFAGSLTPGLQIQRQRRDPVLQLDRAHRADVDVGHPDPAVDVERQRVRHLHVDGVGAGPGARAAGHRHVRDAAPLPHELSTNAATSSASPAGRGEPRIRPVRMRSPAALSARSAPVAAGAGRSRCGRRGCGPGITSGAGAGGGPGCGYHGGGSGLFSS